MSSTGVALGQGARVRIGRGATPTWTTLTGTEDFVVPDISPADEDITAHDSRAGWEETMPGLRPNPDWTVPKHYVPGDVEDVLLTAISISLELVLLEVTPRGASVPFVFQGYAKKWMPAAPVKSKMTAELTVKVLYQVGV